MVVVARLVDQALVRAGEGAPVLLGEGCRRRVVAAPVLLQHHAQRHGVELTLALLPRHERARRHHLLEFLGRQAQQRRRTVLRRDLRGAFDARAVALVVLDEAHLVGRRAPRMGGGCPR